MTQPTKGVAPIKARDLQAIFNPKRPDLYERMAANDLRKPSLAYRLCDTLADFIADIAEKPGTAIALIFLGQTSAVVAAVVFAVLS